MYLLYVNETIKCCGLILGEEFLGAVSLHRLVELELQRQFKKSQA